MPAGAPASQPEPVSATQAAEAVATGAARLIAAPHQPSASRWGAFAAPPQQQRQHQQQEEDQQSCHGSVPGQEAAPAWPAPVELAYALPAPQPRFRPAPAPAQASRGSWGGRAASTSGGSSWASRQAALSDEQTAFAANQRAVSGGWRPGQQLPAGLHPTSGGAALQHPLCVPMVAGDAAVHEGSNSPPPTRQPTGALCGKDGLCHRPLLLATTSSMLARHGMCTRRWRTEHRAHLCCVRCAVQPRLWVPLLLQCTHQTSLPSSRAP